LHIFVKFKLLRYDGMFSDMLLS